MNNDTVDIFGAAEMTHFKPSSLRVMRHRGYGPRSFKLGGKLLYRIDDLEKWIAKQYETTSVGDDVAVNQ